MLGPKKERQQSSKSVARMTMSQLKESHLIKPKKGKKEELNLNLDKLKDVLQPMLQPLIDEITVLKSEVSQQNEAIKELQNKLRVEKELRKETIHNVTTRSDQFVQLCNGVADSVKTLSIKLDEKITDHEARTVEDVDNIDLKLNKYIEAFHQLKNKISDQEREIQKDKDHTRDELTSSLMGFLQTKTNLENDNNNFNVNQEYMIKELKESKKSMKQLKKNSNNVLSSLGSGLSDVQNSVLQLCRWAEAVQVLLERNKVALTYDINAMDGKASFPFPNLKI